MQKNQPNKKAPKWSPIISGSPFYELQLDGSSQTSTENGTFY